MGTVGFIGGKFLPLHSGHIHAITRAMGMVDKLYVVLSSSEDRDKCSYGADNSPYMSPELRLSWLGKELKGYSNIKIVHVTDTDSVDDYDWSKGAERIREEIGEPIDKVFSSEWDYHEIFTDLYPEAEHIVLDEGRYTVPISATDIRLSPMAYWDFIPKSVRPHFVKTVLVTGTESCGKSTLVKSLAQTFNTNYVEEIGRNYSERSLDNLTESDFDMIGMENHIEMEKAKEAANRYLFIDSDALVTQYYLNVYYGAHSPLLDMLIKKQSFDLILHCSPDVPWIDDGYRFNSETPLRERLDNMLKELYAKHHRDYKVIGSTYENRYNEAIEHVRSL